MKIKSVSTALILTLALTLNTGNYILADNEYKDLDNETDITDEDELVRVKSDIDSTYSVTIPKKIVMNGSSKDATYEVKVNNKSDIAGYESLIVKPVGDKLKLTSDNKDSVTMSISQNKTSWAYSEVNDVATGTITEATGEKLTAGSWSGTFNFKVLLVNTLIGVDATNSSGDDLNAYAISLSADETKELTNMMIDKGYIESDEDIQAMVDVYADDFEDTSNLSLNLSKISKVGDRVAVLHYNETTDSFDMVVLANVPDTYTFSSTLDSYSPIIVLKVNDYNHDELLMLQPGIYDANDNLLVSWEDSGIDTKSEYQWFESMCTSATGWKYPKTYQYSPCKRISSYKGACKVVLNNIDISGTGDFFGYCSSVTEFYIGENCNIGSKHGSLFSSCDNIQRIVVSKNNKIFDSRNNCNGIMETATNTLVAGCKITNIPEDTEVIGNGAFFGVGTTNNYIPNSVTKIARLAYVAAKFSSIVIPDNVRVIGGGAFIDCQNLKTVTIGSGVEEMGAEPFYDEIDAIASISSPLTSVEFKNPNNWKVYKIDSSWDNSHPDYDMITNPTNPISISSSALSNKSTAATYLSSVNSYGYRYVWARNK